MSLFSFGKKKEENKLSPSEIVLIVSCVLFVVGVIIGSVVKKRKNKKIMEI